MFVFCSRPLNRISINYHVDGTHRIKKKKQKLYTGMFILVGLSILFWGRGEGIIRSQAVGFHGNDHYW